MEKNQKYFFAKCTRPNSLGRAKNLSRFQFGSKMYESVK